MNDQYLKRNHVLLDIVIAAEISIFNIEILNSIPQGIYRDGQSYLIGLGPFGFNIAQNLDIVDVKSKFGNKYDLGISQMLNYTLRLQTSSPGLF
jgi:hypothetical protein